MDEKEKNAKIFSIIVWNMFNTSVVTPDVVLATLERIKDAGLTLGDLIVFLKTYKTKGE